MREKESYDEAPASQQSFTGKSETEPTGSRRERPRGPAAISSSELRSLTVSARRRVSELVVNARQNKDEAHCFE